MNLSPVGTTEQLPIAGQSVAPIAERSKPESVGTTMSPFYRDPVLPCLRHSNFFLHLPSAQPPQPAPSHPSRRKYVVCWGPRKKRRGLGTPVRTGLSSFAPHGARLGRHYLAHRGSGGYAFRFSSESL